MVLSAVYNLVRQSKVFMVGEAVDDEVEQVLAHYPRIYFACHSRHVKDPRSGVKVSAHQASILDHLDEVDPLSMTDLADHMGVTVTTTTGTLSSFANLRP